ncbi:MAG: fibrobacter succinogenes major paralogous domain-containing protein [bacterium]
MKETILFLSLFFFAISLFAQQEPIIKFYLSDGSFREYNISDIEDILVKESETNNVLYVYFEKDKIAYFPYEFIKNIKFKTDSKNNLKLEISIFGYPNSITLSKIDSVIFKNDENLPITIGEQVWMSKNLDVDHYRNGDTIQQVTDSSAWINLKTGAWCYYHNNPYLNTLYGKLYNGYAITDPRGLAPVGWHIPTEAEWTTLINYLGGEEVAGGKMKETGEFLWQHPNIGATNESGFSARPGAARDIDGSYIFIGVLGCWWSSTEWYDMGLNYWSIINDKTSIQGDYMEKVMGFSVRCVKD